MAASVESVVLGKDKRDGKRTALSRILLVLAVAQFP